MSSSGKIISGDKFHSDASEMQIGIIVSSWNPDITEGMYQDAKESLIHSGVLPNNIIRQDVPGSFELPLGAKFLLNTKKVDAVICLGCIIQGETRHFEFICQAVSSGIMQLGLEYNTPVIFGVLTTETFQQAIDRSGGKHGNKGKEAAFTAIQMASIKRKINK